MNQKVDRHVKRLDEDLNRFEEEQLSGMKTFTYPQGIGPGGPRNTYDDAYQASPYNKGKLILFTMHLIQTYSPWLIINRNTIKK